ncbi:MAG: hypothetical protein R3E53_21395 [Myxococcota bacterium]
MHRPEPIPDRLAILVLIGDHILTVDPATEGASAVAVRGDTIVAVGSRRDVSGADRRGDAGRRASAISAVPAVPTRMDISPSRWSTSIC